ncbi:MAG TPA: hypothetical protein VGP26_15020 [Actinophytocola sp.]|jgi:hypothetical protein|nr:hypothetical protein [Actinophytocola sp.]
MSRPGPPPHGEPPRPYDWQRQFQQPDFGRQQQRRPHPEQQRHQPPEQPYTPYEPYEQPNGQQYEQQQYGQQYDPQYDPRYDQSYGDRRGGYDDRGYDTGQGGFGGGYGGGQDGGQDGGYDGGYDPGYEPGYDRGRDQGYDSGYDQQYRRPTPQEMYPDDGGRRFRLPGFGLILSLVGIAVQLACMLVLPWVSAAAAGGKSLTLPQLWDLATEANAQGFGGWYLFLFSYPLAALGIVLALVSVLESVAGKVIFAGLAILGVGYLLVRYGVGPVAGIFGETKSGFDFDRQQLILIGIAVGALVLVLIMIKTGLAMFRRIAGLILLVIAGVHIYAMRDLFAGGEGLSFAAYGPALGYALSGVAALIGPRRLTPG